MEKTVRHHLKKELTLFNTVLLGIGIILGAGVYALIGAGAGSAGDMLWLAFVIAAVIAVFTGLSYAELSSVFSKEAAEYNYTKKAFGKDWLSFFVSWMLVIAGIVAAATVSLGFAGYFSFLFGGNLNLIALGLVVSMTALSYLGMKDSARFNNIASIIEASGLILVIIIFFAFTGSNNPNVNFLSLPPAGFAGLMSAVALIFFAYIGFESIVNLSEEVKHAKSIVPKALIISIAISTILYILVSISAVGILGSDALSKSKAPLTEAVSKSIPDATLLMSIIALFATGNTVLISMIVVSRILYGMARQNSLPKACSKIGRTGTPYMSVFIVGLITAAFAYFGNLKFIASVTDLGIFIVYFFVNLALIRLRYTKGYRPRFKSPGIGRFPILAFIGLLASLLMFFYFELNVWLLEMGVIAAGLTIFFVFRKRRIK